MYTYVYIYIYIYIYIHIYIYTYMCSLRDPVVRVAVVPATLRGSRGLLAILMRVVIMGIESSD